MKTAIITAALVSVALVTSIAGNVRAHHVTRNGNEWAKTVRVPACTSSQNLEVIWPANANGTVTIECSNLPDTRP